MSDAETLTTAANVLRRLLKETEGKPWCPDYAYTVIRHVERNCEMPCTHQDAEEECPDGAIPHLGRYAGPYIAAMGPVVGAALADWLDWMAAHVASGNEIPALRGLGLEQATAVATAIIASGATSEEAS